jgi:amino acid transporter
MPDWLGKVHPVYGTPYAALIVHAAVSLILVVVNFGGSVIWNWFFRLSLIRHMVLTLGASQGFLFSNGTGVQETFQKLLSLAVVLQLIPFLYMFGALLKIAFDPNFVRGHYGKTSLILAGTSGLLTTILGIALVFFPAQQITSLLSYEIWMFGGTLGFIGLAAFFYYIYGSRKAARKLALGSPVV